ncbi:rhomboid-like protein [Streptomyces anandii]|uniref:rhomboid-like protein n=1 Tax=Streptomyces anandii TaxID=285454 RepID=UPI0037BD32C1
MERTATAEAAASSPPSNAPLPPLSGGARHLLDGMPQQRPRGEAAPVPRGLCAEAAGPVPAAPVRPSWAALPAAWPRTPRPWRLLPGPTSTPFTFWYAALLAVTSLIARYAAPDLMDALYRNSSTDVAHLVRVPLLVLPASALWIAGGVASPYALCFLLVLTALERRTGALRTAGVFLAGHVLATLATEIPVALGVLSGDLPASSLHRLDYGISFGVAASVGALAGLLRPWVRWPLLTLFVATILEDLLTFVDPMTSSGHLISVGLGMTAWPLLRRSRHIP